eukprot:5876089-Amphidinium_carterae.1
MQDLIRGTLPLSKGLFKGPALLAPKVRKVELPTYLARLPVTVQAPGKGVVHNNTSVLPFHTRSLRARVAGASLCHCAE